MIPEGKVEVAHPKTKSLVWWPPSDQARWLNPLDVWLAVNVLQSFQGRAQVLEVGTYQGGWLTAVGRNLPDREDLLTAIDPFPDSDQIRIDFLSNVRHAGLQERTSLFESWTAFSDNSSTELAMDLIHIDGLHTESAVMGDLDRAIDFMSEGALIVVDDWANPFFPGVHSGLFKILSRGYLAMCLVTAGKAYLTLAGSHSKWRKWFEDLYSCAGLHLERYFGDGSGVSELNSQPTDVCGFPVLLSLSPLARSQVTPDVVNRLRANVIESLPRPRRLIQRLRFLRGQHPQLG